ncbi:hypothetical protein [Phytohabitans houttuyneae]|uniref:Membrane protein n=1 Tax=Phytohabitans houttuyneae TaxID=1076126 RepID=A0A6V8K9L0_9ACTN|nr:hypothetical protein [Phytohabitans houttuyneae]GFJ78819.1 membrane protein [Phytohabitans houttuyneae]
MGKWSKTGALLLGTLAVAAAFVWSYAGALHQPTPRDVPVGVVRGDSTAATLLSALRPQLKAIEYPDGAAAADALTRRKVYAVLAATDAGGAPGLTLTTASASGPMATDLITQATTAAAATGEVPLTVADAVPTSGGDPRGLVPFYLVVGLVLGGYLAATVLGLTTGTVPADLDDAALRIGVLAIFAALLGTAGAIITGPVLDVFTAHRPGIAIAGALVTFASGLVASAVQGWLGLFGTGLVIFLFVVLGNPGSGGIYPPEFLPALFRGMHRWNLPGLGTDLVKSVVYFDRKAAGWPITALAVWAAAGVGVLLAAAAVRGRTLRHDSPV